MLSLDVIIRSIDYNTIFHFIAKIRLQLMQMLFVKIEAHHLYTQGIKVCSLAAAAFTNHSSIKKEQA